MWQTIFAVIAALGLTALQARSILENMAKKKQAPFAFFLKAAELLEDVTIGPGKTAGSFLMTGRYSGLPARVETIVDTLNVRKLPSLWLMVTIPDALPLNATFDMMMRPSGPTTFSNFDTLPHTLALPAEFPADAVIRSDDPEHMLPVHVIEAHLEPFLGKRAKELLIAPQGLRMVFQMAEGDRARYGVFRQAEFGEVALDPALLCDILDRLCALRGAILDWNRTVS